MRILIVGANSSLAQSLAHLLGEDNTALSGVFHRRTDHINHDLFSDLVQAREMERLGPSFDEVYILAASINHGTDQKTA